jgi:uncharacterized membrane protein YdbT with pleckstrin-like domain
MQTSLKKEERIILETRLHWLTLAIPVLVTAILSAVLLLYLPKYWYSIFLFLLYLGLIFRQWHNNLWAVTNLRIVDEEGLFSHNTKESPLDKINNVSLHQSFLGSIFGYGDIEIQTAAESGATVYRMVNNPVGVRDAISTAQEEYEVYHAKRLASQQVHIIHDDRAGFAAELEKLFDLKKKGILSEEEYQKRKAKMLE